MKIPSYSLNQNSDYYQEELSKTLQDGLSDNGWTPPVVTTSELVAVEPQMPDQTLWLNETDNEVVMKMPDGSLYKLTKTPYTP